MRINFVIAGVDPHKGTAGHAIIFGHANGLLARGHDVRIVCLHDVSQPQWYDLRAPIVNCPVRPADSAARAVATLSRFAARRVGRREAQSSVSDLVSVAAMRGNGPMLRAAYLGRAESTIPEADVTLATGWPTALPVAVHGSGKLGYFAQHYEVLFAPDSPDPRLEALEARATYNLPLRAIANSSWLAAKLLDEHGVSADLCVNGIDPALYRPSGRAARPEQPTVMSYSGRGVTWKGFDAAAAAVAAVRKAMPLVRWKVFGHGASLPPDNPIAPYEDIGYLSSEQLRDHMASSDVMLCPSWYESFPMYPIEAMASGCPVVTTPLGAEDYARDGDNCVVVTPGDSNSMADGVLRVLSSSDLGDRLRTAGLATANSFTVERSTSRMEQILDTWTR